MVLLSDTDICIIPDYKLPYTETPVDAFTNVDMSQDWVHIVAVIKKAREVREYTVDLETQANVVAYENFLRKSTAEPITVDGDRGFIVNSSITGRGNVCGPCELKFQFLRID